MLSIKPTVVMRQGRKYTIRLPKNRGCHTIYSKGRVVMGGFASEADAIDFLEKGLDDPNRPHLPKTIRLGVA